MTLVATHRASRLSAIALLLGLCPGLGQIGQGRALDTPTWSPVLSLETYGEPFISTGRSNRLTAADHWVGWFDLGRDLGDVFDMVPDNTFNLALPPFCETVLINRMSAQPMPILLRARSGVKNRFH